MQCKSTLFYILLSTILKLKSTIYIIHSIICNLQNTIYVRSTSFSWWYSDDKVYLFNAFMPDLTLHENDKWNLKLWWALSIDHAKSPPETLNLCKIRRETRSSLLLYWQAVPSSKLYCTIFKQTWSPNSLCTDPPVLQENPAWSPHSSSSCTSRSCFQENSTVKALTRSGHHILTVPTRLASQRTQPGSHTLVFVVLTRLTL